MATLDTVPRKVLLTTTAVPSKANLYGFIYDTAKNPLPAVSVNLDGLTTDTVPGGAFSFLGIEPGPYTIRCVKEGYQDFTKRLTLREGDQPIDITMLAEGEKPPSKFPWLWVGIGGGLGATALGLIILGGKKKPKAT